LFDPDAVDTSGSNNRGPGMPDGARVGCLRGFRQIAPGPFAESHQSGTAPNIYDPVAHIATSMNRVVAVWGCDRTARICT
jgi:hypothetical protein